MRCDVGDGRTASYCDGTSPGGWLLPSSRTRNQELACLCSVLLETPRPDHSVGVDSYYWCIEGTSEIFQPNKRGNKSDLLVVSSNGRRQFGTKVVSQNMHSIFGLHTLIAFQSKPG